MVRDARSSKLGKGPISDAGGTFEDLACGGIGRRKPRPLQVVDCCRYNTAGFCDRGIGNGVNMGYHFNSLKGQR